MNNNDKESFFDCNICLDLSKEPILTSCGHLYCWYCFHKWLQVSEAQECPVCRGEVSLETVTPIYGRGGEKKDFFEIPDTNIPSRPHACRVDSLSTIIHRFSREGDSEEMMTSLHESLEREFHTFYNRSMTSRGIRAEQNQGNATIVEALIDDINLSSFGFEENEDEGSATIVEALIDDINLSSFGAQENENLNVVFDDRDLDSNRQM